jgi:hypothetical protein
MDLSGESDKVLRKFNLLPEEERLRRNPEGRPLIFTSFVRYSALVKAMVNTALAEQNTNENSIVICITTLSMSLQKWLNFDDKAQSVHTEWEGYLAFLRSELRTLPNVVLTRILLVKEPHRVNNRVNLRSIPELDEELRNWVWLTKKGPDYSEFAAANVLEPLAAEKKLRILTEMKEHYTPQSQEYRSIAEIRAQTSPNRYSYLILPRTQFPNCPTNMDGGEFVELGTAFISTYHTKQEDGNYHSYYSVVEPSAYVPDPQTDDPPFPLDLFYVAKVRLPNGQPIRTHDLGRLPREPLFCLAARPDEELHMVYLYLLDPQRCPRNFTNIDRYITLHLQTPRLLSDYRMGTLT